MSKFKPPRRASGSPSIASHKDLFSFVFSDNVESWCASRKILSRKEPAMKKKTLRNVKLKGRTFKQMNDSMGCSEITVMK